ncbi:hypothetical protein NIES2107_18020 [Nostoc carneum NIES-2107]|nr:hypothetical protein NIES2107_18020 [Nostoc carneum NIES-2107]
MVKNSEKITIQEAAIGEELLTDDLQNIHLLPRSAWPSQITYLKTLLKTKQTLDRRYYRNTI